jgi:hypothetical protein
MGGWVGPRAGLNAVVKGKIPSPCRDSKPRSSTTELSRLFIITVRGSKGLWERAYLLCGFLYMQLFPIHAMKAYPVLTKHYT